MDSLSLFLKKFKKILSSSEEERKIIAEEVTKVISAEILSENVSLKKGVVFINARPAVKSEIFINKEKILRGIIERGLSSIKGLG